MSTNLDTTKKVSNQKTGREFLIKNGIVPSILRNIKNYSDLKVSAPVYNRLIVIENFCINDDGKNEVKEAVNHFMWSDRKFLWKS